MLRQMPEAGADRAPGRVDARDQQQAHHRDQPVGIDRLAVDLGVRQMRDQVVARLSAALLHLGGEIALRRGKPAHRRRRIGDAEFEHFVDPAAEQRAVLFRHAEHHGDRPDGNFLRVVGRGVAAGLAAKRSISARQMSRTRGS
jgi:hypothetical protein